MKHKQKTMVVVCGTCDNQVMVPCMVHLWLINIFLVFFVMTVISLCVCNIFGEIDPNVWCLWPQVDLMIVQRLIVSKCHLLKMI